MRCPHPDHQQNLDHVEDLLIHLLEHQIAQEATMTQFANDQAHLDDAVTKLTDAFGTAITELKATIANHPDLPASTINFSKLDSLVASAQAEASADAPAPVVEAPVTNSQGLNGGVVPAPTAAAQPAATGAAAVTEAPATWNDGATTAADAGA